MIHKLEAKQINCGLTHVMIAEKMSEKQDGDYFGD